jgi:hypothetical protein
MTPEELRALSSTLFVQNRLIPASAPAGSGLGGLTTKSTIYVWPRDVTDKDKRDILSVFPVIGKGTTDRVAAWQVFALTLSCLCFPALEEKIKATGSADYLFSPLPAQFCQGVRDLVEQIQLDPSRELPVPELPLAPLTPALYSAEYWNCGTVLGIYSYYALVTHLMGKRVDQETRDAITVRRPGNLIDKFSAGSASYILTGDGRMSDEAHLGINSAWGVANSARKPIIKAFCVLRAADDLPSRILFTMFGMLEYSGMQPAVFIHNLLTICPWVIADLPALRPAYDVYKESVVAFATADPEFRPYLKLYYGDSSQIFHAKTLVDLIALAVEVMVPNNPTLAGYKAPGGDKAKAAFAEACRKRGIDISSGMIAPVISAPEESPVVGGQV